MVGSVGLDGYHVLYSLLYTTASLPMMLGPKAQALSYHVPTKYLFLRNSQVQASEIPVSYSAELANLVPRAVSLAWVRGGQGLVDHEKKLFHNTHVNCSRIPLI